MTRTIKVAFTAAGAPQAATLIRQFKTNAEFPIHMVALDMKPDVIGRFLADSFHLIPPAGADGYDERLLEIFERERPDALLNCSENDVPHIARLRPRIEALGCKVLCSEPETIAILTDKHALYATLSDEPSVQIPEFKLVESLDEFIAGAEAMGYPRRDLCFKPPVSKGSRGFRILTERFDRRDLLLNHKPIARYMPLDDFVSIFRNEIDFPRLLLMEVVTGDEYDVMNISLLGRSLLTSVKSRESHRWGVIDRGEIVNRPEIVSAVAAISEKLNLSYNTYFQFIGDKLIEMGPRTSTYIYQKELIEPWVAVKLAIGLISADEVATLQNQLRIGRRMIRYMDQIFYDPDGSWND